MGSYLGREEIYPPKIEASKFVFLQICFLPTQPIAKSEDVIKNRTE